MLPTELDEFMKLTTFKVKSGEIDFDVTVMGPTATMKILSVLPDDGEFNLNSFIRDNYLMLARDVVHSCIVSPKIPVERVSMRMVNDLFPTLFRESFPEVEESDGEFQS